MALVTLRVMVTLNQKLLNYAYSLLARREYSVCEVRQKLHSWLLRYQKSEAEDEAGELDPTDQKKLILVIIKELQDQAYLSDERFTRLFIEQKQNINGWGQQKIWQKLRQKGIDESIFVVLWSELESEVISEKIKNDVQRKWINLVQKQKSQTEVKSALLRFLAGRGFGYARSQKILDAVNPDQV